MNNFLRHLLTTGMLIVMISLVVGLFVVTMLHPIWILYAFIGIIGLGILALGLAFIAALYNDIYDGLGEKNGDVEVTTDSKVRQDRIDSILDD